MSKIKVSRVLIVGNRLGVVHKLATVERTNAALTTVIAADAKDWIHPMEFQRSTPDDYVQDALDLLAEDGFELAGLADPNGQRCHTVAYVTEEVQNV